MRRLGLLSSRHVGALALCLALGLAACSSSSASHAGATTTTVAVSGSATTEEPPTPTSGPPVPASVTGGKATIDVKVGTDDFTTTGGKRVVSVPKNTDVTINITSTAAEDYHLHGYDLEQKADAGTTSTFNFTADQTGQFDLESHVTENTLLVLVVS
ncbi:MAG TPA: hypothetical protein VGF22_05715 [Acidimicrobiales bacterium]